MQNNVLSIWLWGQELGRIYWDTIQSRAVFEYNSAFISAGMDVAPLSASIHSVAAGRPILAAVCCREQYQSCQRNGK